MGGPAAANLSVTVASGWRRAVEVRPPDPDDAAAAVELPQRQFRMPDYVSPQQRMPLRLNNDFPLHNFIVVTLGKRRALLVSGRSFLGHADQFYSGLIQIRYVFPSLILANNFLACFILYAPFSQQFFGVLHSLLNIRTGFLLFNLQYIIHKTVLREQSATSIYLTAVTNTTFSCSFPFYKNLINVKLDNSTTSLSFTTISKTTSCLFFAHRLNIPRLYDILTQFVLIIHHCLHDL